MKSFKQLFNYLHQIIFLPPASSYIWLNLVLILLFAVLTLPNFGESGSEFIPIAFIGLFLYLNIPIAILLLWRSISLKSYSIGTKWLLIIFLIAATIIIPAVALVNYQFDVNQETEKRDSFIQTNLDYALSPDKRIDTSIPAAWIKSDDEIKSDARNYSLSTAVLSALTPVVVIAPLGLIFFMRKKLENKS